MNPNSDPYTGCIITNSRIGECGNVHSDSEWDNEISSSSIFKSCLWNKCSGNPSGAIYCHASGLSLIINDCVFAQCVSTAPFRGLSAGSISGAVYVNGIKEIRVDKSNFLLCSAPQNESDNAGSGAICINAVTPDIAITHSNFISCFTGSSGAALFIVFSSSVNADTASAYDCRFLCCTADGHSPDGAGTNLYGGTGFFSFRSCIFAKLKAYYGGALCIFYPSAERDPPPIRYSFFTRNTGTQGSDVWINCGTAANTFLHCFSTSEKSVCVNYNPEQVSWLPQANINSTLMASLSGDRHNALHSKGISDNH